MACFKDRCPTCGGTVTVSEGQSIGECDSCGRQYTASELRRREHSEPYGARVNESGFYEDALPTDSLEDDETQDLFRRSELALASEQWDVVYEYCDELVRRDPSIARAYLYRLLADQHLYRKEELAGCTVPFDGNDSYRLLLRFGSAALVTEIKSYADSVRARYEADRREERYRSLVAAMAEAVGADRFASLADGFRALGAYKDSPERLLECLEREKRVRAAEKRRTVLAVAIPIVAVTLAVLLVAAAAVIFVVVRSAQYSAKNVEFRFLDKVNESYDDDYVRVVFDIDIVNGGKKNIRYVEGYLTVKDRDGNVLTSGTADFSGEMHAESTSGWDLTWRMNRRADSETVWNTEYEDLEIFFRITEIRFEDGTHRTYDGADLPVKGFSD